MAAASPRRPKQSDTASPAHFCSRTESTVCRSRRRAFSPAIPARSSARSMADTRPASARSTRNARTHATRRQRAAGPRPLSVREADASVDGNSSKIRVAVAGGTGYMGIELLRLLALHPRVDVRRVTSEQYAGKHLADVYPAFR